MVCPAASQVQLPVGMSQCYHCGLAIGSCQSAATSVIISAPITCTSGAALPWVDEVRYLGVFMKRSRVFKCSLDHAN